MIWPPWPHCLQVRFGGATIWLVIALDRRGRRASCVLLRVSRSTGYDRNNGGGGHAEAACALCALRGHADDRARRDDRERRPAIDPAGSGFLAEQPRLGRERLP